MDFDVLVSDSWLVSRKIMVLEHVREQRGVALGSPHSPGRKGILERGSTSWKSVGKNKEGRA